MSRTPPAPSVAPDPIPATAAAADAEGAGPAPRPWRWVPTLYFTQGLPYVVVTALSLVMLKHLGRSNAEIALLTSAFAVPWVAKPLWGPLPDLFGRKRGWVVALQALLAAGCAALAVALPWAATGTAGADALLLAVFLALALASATHDIAADGLYLLALDARRQAAFVGVRSTAYRAAMISGQGALVVAAGWLIERSGGDPVRGWQALFAALAVALALLVAWHAHALPRPADDRPAPRQGRLHRDFAAVLAGFFRRPDVLRVLAFLLLYRFAEAQSLKLVVPFLLDPPAAGGLGLTTQQLGWVYGTLGVAALTAGGLLGGWWVARRGLLPLLWPLLLAMHVPNLLFVALAAGPPPPLAVVAAALAVEQFGYGLGFTAYLVALLRLVADSPHRAAHYALCTGFMALGMLVPGAWAGWLQQQLGYAAFFAWTCVATLPSFAVTLWLARDPALRS